MLTGDNQTTANAIARDLGVDEVKADLMPEDKVAMIADLQKRGYKVAMVGDGVNDAPALARADIGIAMGGGGTQAALEAADIALMTDDLGKIVGARTIARRAYRTVQKISGSVSEWSMCLASPPRSWAGLDQSGRRSSIWDQTFSCSLIRSSFCASGLRKHDGGSRRWPPSAESFGHKCGNSPRHGRLTGCPSRTRQGD